MDEEKCFTYIFWYACLKIYCLQALNPHQSTNDVTVDKSLASGGGQKPQRTHVPRAPSSQSMIPGTVLCWNTTTAGKVYSWPQVFSSSTTESHVSPTEQELNEVRQPNTGPWKIQGLGT